jgi:hypothetical protein
MDRIARRTVTSHDQQAQREVMRDLIERYPQITGDEQFLRVLGMDDSEFEVQLRVLWDPQPRPRPRRTPPASRRRTRQEESHIMGPVNVYAHISDGRVRRVPVGTRDNHRFVNHPDWQLRQSGEPPDPPAAPVVDIVHKGGGWFQLTRDGELVDDRAYRRGEAEARAAELQPA